jgi:hypothetical protein
MENIIVKNILTQEQIDHIYSQVDSAPKEKTTIQTRLGHQAYFVGFDESLRVHFEKIIQKHYGEEWILTDFQFARYSTKFGYKPKLYPHFDDAFEVHKLTLDVQINSTLDWPIVVEGKEFLLKNNEGVVFSGTDQIHWRAPADLSDTDVVDMMFCHAERKDGPNKFVTKEHQEKMFILQEEWAKKIDINRGEEKI